MTAGPLEPLDISRRPALRYERCVPQRSRRCAEPFSRPPEFLCDENGSVHSSTYAGSEALADLCYAPGLRCTGH